MNTKSILYLLAVILLLLLGLFWFANNKFSNEALGQLNLEKLGLNPEEVVRGSNTDDPFEKGAKALAAKDFQKAAAFFENIPADHETYIQARLFLAYAQYEAGEYKKAIANAKLLIEKSKDPVTKQKAEWIQLQAMLNEGAIDDATFDELLEQIATNEKHLVQSEALELKESMNSPWRGLVF